MNNANSWPKCLWMCFSPPYYQCRTIFRPDKLEEFLGSVMKFKTAAVCNSNVKTVIKWSVSKSCFLHLVLPWALIQGKKQRFTWIRFACFWASKWDRQAVRGTLDFAYFLFDDWTAFGLIQLRWHGLERAGMVWNLWHQLCVHSGWWCCLTHYTHRRPQMVAKPAGLKCVFIFLAGRLISPTLFNFLNSWLVCKHSLDLTLLAAYSCRDKPSGRKISRNAAIQLFQFSYLAFWSNTDPVLDLH